MTPKDQPKQDDPEQSARFIETAKAIEAAESEEEFARVFSKVASKRTKSLPKRS